MRETWVQSVDWEDPLEKGKATHSSILAWRNPWVTKNRTQLSDFLFHSLMYVYLNRTRPGADCGSDHELLIAKFRFKLKKVGKTA